MTLRRTLAIVGPGVTGLGLSVAFWSRVPDRIPIHWDDNGDPDGYAPKAVVLLAVPVVGVLIGWLTSWAVGKGNAPRAADGLAFAFGLFDLGLHGMIIAAALHPENKLAIGPLIVMLGALFTALGAAMPHLDQNKWAGVRTPWTLADEVNWKLTHRFAGWTMGIGGALAAIAGVALEGRLAFWAGFTSVMIGSLLPVGYSYVIHRMRRRPGTAR
ncbi:MAG: SdpI family protein [Deltaproteobacteria bacterium]|nr:SdpI family protein [Deltaproteobacteria bacterium]